MQVSYSTLAVLDQCGDVAAHTILHAWMQEAGILWEPEFLQVHYCPINDYLVMRGQQRTVVAPYRWQPTPRLPIINNQRSCFHKVR